MPTPIPPEVEPPKSEEERSERIKALYLVNKLLDCLDGWAYATRSHMPNGVDCIEFLEAVVKVRSFYNSRPDWTNAMVKRVFERYTVTSESEQEGYLVRRSILLLTK